MEIRHAHFEHFTTKERSVLKEVSTLNHLTQNSNLQYTLPFFTPEKGDSDVGNHYFEIILCYLGATLPTQKEGHTQKA